MASEARQLRPFTTLDDAQAFLDQFAQITGHEPEKVTAFAGQTLPSETDPYLSRPFTLWFGRNETDNEKLKRSVFADVQTQFADCPGVVHLVVSVRNARLKMTDLVLDQPLVGRESIPFAVSLHEVGPDKVQPRPLQTPGDGCRVVVELLLGRDLEPAERTPLRAWRKGSWLARVEFGITTSGAFSGPRPRPLTEVVRQQLGISDQTVHFADVFATGEQLLTAGAFDDILDFYVDEDVLGQVRDHPQAGWSMRLQRGWILQVIQAYLLAVSQSESFQEFDPETEPWDGSILRAVLDKVSGTEAIPTPTDALELLRYQPGRFLAELEDRAELRALERLILPGQAEGAPR